MKPAEIENKKSLYREEIKNLRATVNDLEAQIHAGLAVATDATEELARRNRELEEMHLNVSKGLAAALDKVNRFEEKMQMVKDAFEKILQTIPAIGPGGEFFVEHYDGEGNYAGTQTIDPVLVIQEMTRIAEEAEGKL